MDSRGHSKIPMGGSNSTGSGIIFGNKTISLEEEAETTLTFSIS